MTTVTVSTSDQINAALKSAVSGETILLRPGAYSGVTIKNIAIAGTVTVKSALATSQATLTSLSVVGSSGFTFKGLQFNTAGVSVDPTAAHNTWDFQIYSSDRINFNGIALSGDPNGTLANTICGLFFENDTNSSVTASNFQHVHTAVQFVESTGVTVSGDKFSYVFDDGVDFGGCSNVVVNGNAFTTFHMDPTDTQHPDAIQFWSAGTTSSQNITVTKNTYVRGAGTSAVHGVFIKDVVGNLPFQNVLIQGNTIKGANYNGITVDGANNVTITGNTSVSYADMTPSWIGAQNTSNVTISYNKAMKILDVNNVNDVLIGNTTNKPTAVPTAVQGFADAMAMLGGGNAGVLTALAGGQSNLLTPMIATPARTA